MSSILLQAGYVAAAHNMFCTLSHLGAQLHLRKEKGVGERARRVGGEQSISKMFNSGAEAELGKKSEGPLVQLSQSQLTEPSPGLSHQRNVLFSTPTPNSPGQQLASCPLAGGLGR